jgi:hypothetical protein
VPLVLLLVVICVASTIKAAAVWFSVSSITGWLDVTDTMSDRFLKNMGI